MTIAIWAASMALCACVAVLAIAHAAPPTASIPTKAAESTAEQPPSVPNMIRFGPEQGLSKSINDLAIDRQGFVWIATADGLARYDGIGFRHWRHDPKRGDSLPANNILVISVDAYDRIWVVANEKLSVLSTHRGGFRHLHFKGDDSRCAKNVAALSPTNDGGMLIGTYDGHLCKVSSNWIVSLVVDKNRDPISLHGAIPTSIFYRSDNDILIGTDVGLFHVVDGVVKELQFGGAEKKFIFSISEHANDSIAVGTNNGLYILSNKVIKKEISTAVYGQLKNATVVRSSAKGSWLGTENGLFWLNYSGEVGKINPNRKDKKILNSFFEADRFSVLVEEIDSIDVFTMKVDRDGGLWIATYSRGLIYLPSAEQRFLVISNIASERFKERHNTSISADLEGGAWLLGDKGLFHIEKYGKRVDFVRSAKELEYKSPRSITACPNGVVWIAHKEGIFGYDHKANKVIFRAHIDDISSGSIPQSIVCHLNDVWMSLYGGSIVFISSKDKKHHVIAAESAVGGVKPGAVNLKIGLDNAIWITDDHNLRRWNGYEFITNPIKRGEAIATFDFSKNSNEAGEQIYIARFGSLERYSLEKQSLALKEMFDVENGMPQIDFDGLMVSKNGNVWLSSTRGLVLYDRSINRARLFGIHDGLPGADFYYGPPVMLGPNRAVALSADGLAFFDPELGLAPAKPSLLSIETLSLRRDGGEVALDPSRPVRMLAGDRDLRIVPRLMSFSNPLSHRYRSRLHGEDPTWVLQQGPSERVFSRLPPGRYTLELQAANADGAWSKPMALSIEVMPPWWRSVWALVAYVLLASALLWWLSYLDRLRLKRRHTYQMAKQKRELAEQASDAKSRFLADLGHELRTPMTGVLGMSELLLASGLEPRQHGQAQSIRRAGEHLLRLVDDALDLARVEAGRLELQRVEFGLDASIDEIAGLMSPLATRKGLRFSVERDPDVPDRWVGDPLRLKQIVLNLLGNAVKFTERGSVGLRIEAVAPPLDSASSSDTGDARSGLRIAVWDTGPGMNEEQVARLFRRFEQADGARTTARYGGTGLGLAISRELAIAMGGDIRVRSVLAEGTTFVLHLPLSPSEANDADTALVAPTRPSSTAPTPTEWYVVLLVEDDPTVAEVLTGLLQRNGHRVVHAAHGLAAMTEAAVGRFDAAFLDLDLPGIDGCALAEQLRANGFAAPMIAITARADTQAEADATAAGFVEFLRKPTTGERLESALRRALARDAADAGATADRRGSDMPTPEA